MEAKKFQPILNPGNGNSCLPQMPPPCPGALPPDPCPPGPCPPGPCPHPPNKALRDCIEYINSYIDLRARQLYLKLKHPTIIKIEARCKEAFLNPIEQPILKFKGIGINGQDVDVYCESLVGAIQDRIKLRDRGNGKIYAVYVENGEIKTHEIIETVEVDAEG